MLEGLKVTTKWAGALVALSAKDVSFIENKVSKINRHTIDVQPVITKLRKWEKTEKAKRNNKLPHYDYIAVFTNYDIRGHEPLIGKANGVGTICNGITIGLVKYMDIRGTTRVLSHEMGHSLGLIHDGESNNCNSSDNFIMANTWQAYSKNTILNSYQFSNCSLSYFLENIEKLDRSKKNCLADGGEDFNSGRERDVFLHLYPGQIYDLDDQCKMTFGSKSFYCGGDANDEIMCQTIKCSEAGYCKATFLKALDGTSCSSGSWCRRGKCVADRRAPRAPKRCVNGDRRKYYYLPNDRTSLCDQVNKNRTMCYQSPHKDLCCASCSGKENYGGCRDTISECSSLEPKDCYSNYYATTCCKTCETLVKNPSDTTCLYGDRGDSCSDMVPGVCYLKTRLCCQTCSAYLSSPNRTSSFPKEYGKTLEYVDVWGRLFYLNCMQLVNRDSSLCYYDEVQRYCYDSCRSVELVKDFCVDGDYKGLLTYLSKKFSCEELVKYNPSLCEKKDIKNQCCESCANFTIRPLSSKMVA